MKVNIPDIVVKEDLIIECDVTFGWMYIIEVFNDTYLQFVQPGGFHFPIKYNGLEAGEYEAKVTMMDNKYCYATYTTHFKVLKENTTTNINILNRGESFEIINDLPSMSESEMSESLSPTNDLSSGISTDTNVLEDNLTPEAKNNNLSHYNIGKTISNNQNMTGVALVLFVLITFCLFVVARKREN